MSLRLLDLYGLNPKLWKIGIKRLYEYKKVDGMLHHQELYFVLEIIQTELISLYHNKL